MQTFLNWFTLIIYTPVTNGEFKIFSQWIVNVRKNKLNYSNFILTFHWDLETWFWQQHYLSWSGLEILRLQQIHSDGHGKASICRIYDQIFSIKNFWNVQLESGSINVKRIYVKSFDVKSNNIDVEGTEQMLAYKMMIRLFTAVAKFFGIEVRYDWIPARSFLYWFTNILLLIVWCNIIYTVIFHCMNDNLRNIVQPLGILGISSSVIRKNKGVGKLDKM